MGAIEGVGWGGDNPDPSNMGSLDLSPFPRKNAVNKLTVK